jgi:hypothetical protein
MKRLQRLLAPGGGRPYRCATLVFCVVASAALVLSIAGTGVASAQPASPRAAAALRTIRFRVVNATDLTLTVDRVINNGAWREYPTTIEPWSVGDYNAESTVGSFGDVRAEVHYKIGNYSPTHWLEVRAHNPLTGFNTGSCYINGGLPFTCKASAGSGNDMNATFVINYANPTPYDITPDTGLQGGPLPSERQLAQAYCGPGAPPALIGCDVASADDVINVKVVEGPKRIVSDILINCTGSTADKTLSTANTVTEANTIGVTSEVTYKMSDTVTPKLSVTYQHQWTHSLTTTDTVKVTAKPGEYLYMTQAAYMQEVTADWTITLGDQIFRAADLVLLRPSMGVKPNAVTAFTASVPTDFCTGSKSGTSFLDTSPLTPAAGGAYTIRPNSANGRSITVADRSHAADALLQLAGASNSDPSRQWVFYELPNYPGYFQIRNAHTLNMCMDLNGLNWYTVMQFYCKGPTDPTIANQLWRIAYDPGTNSLEVVSMQTVDGKGRSLALANSNFDIGDPVVGVASPGVTTGRWLFHTV